MILVTCLVAAFSPFGRTKIGGPEAKPILPYWKWVAIALCTNTAVGIFFWSAAEPMYHISSPPASLGLEPNSKAAAIYAMSTMYLHWSFIPCALYALPGLMFSFAYYNMRCDFSISSCLAPLTGRKPPKLFSHGIDAVCLYTLVTGMSASLATGVLSIAGGVENMWGIKSNEFTWIVIGSLVVGAFVASAASGLQRGIRILSDINMKLFFVLAGFVLLFGPTAAIFKIGAVGIADFTQNFFNKSLLLQFSEGDPWPKQWTVFYWAVWLAWAPVSALFLGRIAYGYTIRRFVVTTLLIPACFAIVWMSIFSGTAISFESFSVEGAGLIKVLSQKGPEGVAYAVLNRLPLSFLVIPFFLLSVFISYVTAADSNTTAMAGLSSKISHLKIPRRNSL